jgi:DNA-nicking Smr family endonuclease
VKKKDSLSQKDKEDWKNFLEDTSFIPDKDQTYESKNKNQLYKYDLHGHTLSEANKKVKEIIISCSKKNYTEILLITGKGLHSRDDDVYKSSKLSKLKYSVPEYINSEPEISKLISSIVNPPPKDGGDGALLIKLRKLQNKFR